MTFSDQDEIVFDVLVGWAAFVMAFFVCSLKKPKPGRDDW